MNLTSVKNILKGHHLLPKKRLGQNFLIDRGVLGKIIAAADLNPEDTVLEIGPGLGVLTQELAKRVKRVVAVEKDEKMAEILTETLKGVKNVGVVRNDILKIENWDLIENWKLKIENYKVVANLPYYIVSPVIRQFLEHTEARPLYAVLMVQKEVAQRICAKPPNMSLLAVSVQFYAKPKIISYVSKKSFWPRPKVDSAILKITPLKNVQRTKKSCRLFFRVVKAGFSQPRKQLINNLSKGLKIDKKKVEDWLKENAIQPTKRAETLTVNDWIKLTKSIGIN